MSNLSLEFFLMDKLLNLSSLLLIMLLLNHLLLLILFLLLFKDDSLLFSLLFLGLFFLLSLELYLLLWPLIGLFDLFLGFLISSFLRSFVSFDLGKSLLLLLLGNFLFQLLFLESLFLFPVGFFLILIELIKSLSLDLEVLFVLLVKLGLFWFNVFLVFLSLFSHCLSFCLFIGSFFESFLGSHLLILNIFFDRYNFRFFLLFLG